MNGMKSLGQKTLFPLLYIVLAIQANAINIWPDRVEPPVRLDEAIAISKTKVAEIESDNFYCVNATLLNGEEGDTATGYWAIGYMTETGKSYSAAVRMDRKLSVKEIKAIEFNLPNHWPDTVTPVISVEDALTKAESLLNKEGKNLHYCLNATLITSSNDVIADGMWNFVFQTTTDDPQLVNIRMNGKTKVKEIKHLEEYKLDGKESE